MKFKSLDELVEYLSKNDCKISDLEFDLFEKKEEKTLEE